MHGELLEFNQFMHQQMVNKDKVIAIMRTQLASARGVVSFLVRLYFIAMEWLAFHATGSVHASCSARLLTLDRILWGSKPGHLYRQLGCCLTNVLLLLSVPAHPPHGITEYMNNLEHREPAKSLRSIILFIANIVLQCICLH